MNSFMISRNLTVKLRFSEKDGSGNFPRLNVDVTKFGISAVLDGFYLVFTYSGWWKKSWKNDMQLATRFAGFARVSDILQNFLWLWGI